MKNQNLFSFLGGLTVGAIAALLLAPDSGKNTRHKIGDKIKHGEKKIRREKPRGAENSECQTGSHQCHRGISGVIAKSMDNHTSPGRIGQTAQDLKEYASLRVDSFRLSLIDNLSSFFNSLFGVFILIVLLGIATTFFAIALTWVLGIALGSMLLAIVLMGCLFVVFAIIVYALRRKLIINQTVRMLSGMVHDMSQKHSDYEK